MKKIYSLLLLAGLCLVGAQSAKATDYYVAHNQVLNANEWKENVDKMTLNDGVYKYTFYGVGTNEVKFKITLDGSWNNPINSEQKDQNSPVSLDGDNDQNICFTLSAPANVTITYDPDNNLVSVSKEDIASFVVTVYLNATAAMNLYAWTDEYKYSNTSSALELNGGWPGSTSQQEQEAINGINWYKYTFNAYYNDYLKLIFNNGSNQTTNIDVCHISENTTLFFTANTESTDGSGHWNAFVRNYPYSIRGTMNSWRGDDVFVENQVTLSLEAGKYTFKVTDGNTWYGLSGSDVSYIQINNCANWALVSSNTDCGIEIPFAGDYTFSWNDNEKKVSVSYPESFTREAANTNYQTLCVPFDAAITNATVYDVTAVSSTVTISEHAGNLVAGESYIIKPTENAVANGMVISKVLDGTSVAAAKTHNVEETALYGTLQPIEYDHNSDPNPNWTVYVLYDNMFYLLSGTATSTIASTRAYLHVILPANNAPEALRIIEVENGATSIENIEANDTAVKFIENGQLLILKNGVVYDVTGAIVR